MKNQALFSSNDKIKKLNCRLLQFLFGALRVTSRINRVPTSVGKPIDSIPPENTPTPMTE